MKQILYVLLAACMGNAQPARPRILGIAHAAFRVSDIEKSRTFYKDFLGFAEPFSLSNPDGSLSLTFIKINDTQYIELFPGLEPGADRLHHLALQTDDAERMRLYLASRGVKVPDHVPKGRIGNLNFNITDPDGHTIEIVEYAADGWSLRRLHRVHALPQPACARQTRRRTSHLSRYTRCGGGTRAVGRPADSQDLCEAARAANGNQPAAPAQPV
jgi:lactoylglutathione lyase